MNSQTLSRPAATVASSALGLLECMRPAQWIKNGFVLSALLFSTRLADPDSVVRALSAFAAFCLAASGVYLWNDTADWRSDLVHPEKRTRPIPSGRLHPVLAALSGTLLLAFSVVLAFSLSRTTGLVLATYIAINAGYNLGLKHVLILDLLAIALGFVLRVLAGASAIRVEPSHWILTCTFLLALFLGVAKRRQEIMTLADDRGRHRKVLSGYTLAWLDQASTLLASASLVAYALYTVSPETQSHFGTSHLIYTLPLVVYGLLRYMHLVHASDRTGNPTAALLTDRPLLACVALWVVMCAVIIYR